MKLGANTKDTPTARWERAAEEADVVTEDTEEGRERERDSRCLSTSISLRSRLCTQLFEAGKKRQQPYLL